MTRVAFVTTCKNRLQHLRLTLPKNVAHNADYGNAVFVVIDYSSGDGLREWVETECAEHLESGRLAVYEYRTRGRFRMAHAKNLAHRAGIREGAEILVNMDADNFTGHGFAAWVAGEFNRNPRAYLWARMIKDGPGRLPRGISGRIAVSRQGWLAAGGYDERYESWGSDDKDFNVRLSSLGYAGAEIPPGFLSAVLHNDRMRFREYPEIRDRVLAGDSYEAEFYSCPQRPIANMGQAGCGVVWRNYLDRVEFKPFPARIFGIGMHKTGTTSLHEALKILGFDSAHWTNAHWAKAVWREMRTMGQSPALERHYAAGDLPVGLLYRELDVAYPGSKFVLTVRDERDWLESVRNHFSERNPNFSNWDTDPFTNRIHTQVYGRKNFDAEIFLARYRRHNAEVLEYFKDRLDDLLVMNISSGAGWKELCAFLGTPAPAQPYPRANGAAR